MTADDDASSAVPRITNPKVAGLEPTWRTYRGLTVLFDNPGCAPPPRQIDLRDVPVDDPTAQRLYDVLAAFVDDLGADGWRCPRGFCPLPRSTYHVTVCDCLNERQLGLVERRSRSSVAALVRGVPGSLDTLPSVLPMLARPALARALGARPITFVTSGIVISGHVMAARLTAADPDSQAALDEVAAARAELADRIHTELGVGPQPWRPHVSLGYFVNGALARAADDSRSQLDRGFALVPKVPITFTSAAVYGFTDMVSYFRSAV